ncbi:MAG: YjgP/YjgQ family permease [Bacteroidetes bacterium]|nr:MAG: YjgP/YjgQ family permease [Bacteroidota bacterium]
MDIIDKYIIRKFLSTFFFMIGVVMLLSTVFDISARLGEFIENNASASAIIFDYYVHFIIYYGNTFSSLIIFLSVIWFTAKMAQDSEIIPLLFSSRPFTRILRPYFIAASILVVFSLILNHFVIPRSNKTRLAFEERFYRDRMFVQDYHVQFPGNKIVYFSSYLSDYNVFNDFRIEVWDKKNKAKSILVAKSAKNELGTNRWKLEHYYSKHFGYPKDRLEVRNKKDTTFEFQTHELVIRENRAETMTYKELKAFIARESEKGNPNVPLYELELHRRTSLPFATYFLTLMGVAVSSRKKRGGIGINIAIGLFFVFVYIFTMQVTTVAAEKIGFPPVIAVWIPNILFGLIGYYMYKVAPK